MGILCGGCGGEEGNRAIMEMEMEMEMDMGGSCNNPLQCSEVQSVVRDPKFESCSHG